MATNQHKLIAIVATLLLAACSPQKPAENNASETAQTNHSATATSEQNTSKTPDTPELFSECHIDDYCFDSQRQKISSWAELDRYYIGADEQVDLLRLDPDSTIGRFAAAKTDCSTLNHQLVRIHCNAAQQPQNCSELEKSISAAEESGNDVDWRQLDACVIEGLRQDKSQTGCTGLSADSLEYCEYSQALLNRDAALCKPLPERSIASCSTTVAALLSDQGKQCKSPACFAEAAAVYPSHIESMPFNCGPERNSGHAAWRSKDCRDWQARANAMRTANTAECKDYSCVVWVVTRQLSQHATELLPPAKPSDETLITLEQATCPKNKTYPANLCRTAFYNRLARKHADASLCIEGYFNRAECLFDFRTELARSYHCESMGRFSDGAQQELIAACKGIAAKFAKQ